MRDEKIAGEPGKGRKTSHLSQNSAGVNPNGEGPHRAPLRFRLTMGPIIPSAAQGVWVTEG
jgi:hypothetical protein